MGLADTELLRPPLLGRRRGFTLVELLVSLAIIAILTAIAIPNWSTLLPGYALSSAARQVQSALHNLKSRAVSQNASFTLVFSGATYSIQKNSTATGESGTLPDGITLAATSDTTLGFTSRGTSIDASDKKVMLCNAKKNGKNVVLSDTGRVRIDDAGC